MEINRHRALRVAKEDILRAIVELQIDSLEEIRQELETPESLPKAIDQLVTEGLVCLSERSVRLTLAGEEAAGVIVTRHRAIEDYFRHEVGCEEAHRIAHRLEHIIVEEVVYSLKRIRELEKKGSPLSGDEWGEGLITRVDIADSQLFDRMISMGICPGQWIRTIKRFYGGLIILLGNTQLAVDWEIASQIEVMFP
jgi:Mn-dependent DtxR family transcriptional regulator/Fe2+ transport system protein FeoA